MIGIGLEKPNEWAFDTTQFDNILKRLKVVCFALNLRISFTMLYILISEFLMCLFGYVFFFNSKGCKPTMKV